MILSELANLPDHSMQSDAGYGDSMSTYLLVITPDRIVTATHSKVFLGLIGCNLHRDPPAFWNGVISGSDGTTGTLWLTMLQMKDEAVNYGSDLTVVWSPNPLDETVDPNRHLYHSHRNEIISLIDDLAVDLGTERPSEAAYFGGSVCWVLRDANLSVLADDLATGYRAQFKLFKDAKFDS